MFIYSSVKTAIYKFLHLVTMKVLMSILCLCSVFAIVVLLSSCRHEPMGVDSLETVCFETQVLPIFQTSCAISGCHGASNPEEGFDATNYNSIIRLVEPGKPLKSEVYRVITSHDKEMMPPDKPLTKEQRTLIEVWILQGAQNTNCSANNPDNGEQTDCFVQTISPIIRSNCATSQCHDAVTHKEGLALTSYASIKSLVKVGNPDGSKLIQVLNASGEDRMPPLPKNPLSADQVASLRNWISKGAFNSDCPSQQCDTTNAISYSSQIWPIIQDNCKGCHSSPSPGGDVLLTNYSEVKASVQNLRNGTSVLEGSITQLNGFKAMPQGSKLDKCSIRKIQLWISQGSANDSYAKL